MTDLYDPQENKKTELSGEGKTLLDDLKTQNTKLYELITKFPDFAESINNSTKNKNLSSIITITDHEAQKAGAMYAEPYTGELKNDKGKSLARNGQIVLYNPSNLSEVEARAIMTIGHELSHASRSEKLKANGTLATADQILKEPSTAKESVSNYLKFMKQEEARAHIDGWNALVKHPNNKDKSLNEIAKQLQADCKKIGGSDYTKDFFDEKNGVFTFKKGITFNKDNYTITTNDQTIGDKTIKNQTIKTVAENYFETKGVNGESQREGYFNDLAKVLKDNRGVNIEKYRTELLPKQQNTPTPEKRGSFDTMSNDTQYASNNEKPIHGSTLLNDIIADVHRVSQTNQAPTQERSV